jgi:hypothetical protein
MNDMGRIGLPRSFLTGFFASFQAVSPSAWCRSFPQRNQFIDLGLNAPATIPQILGHSQLLCPELPAFAAKAGASS